MDEPRLGPNDIIFDDPQDDIPQDDETQPGEGKC